MFTSELVEAAQSGDGKRVEALLQKGEDVNRAGMVCVLCEGERRG